MVHLLCCLQLHGDDELMVLLLVANAIQVAKPGKDARAALMRQLCLAS